MRSRDAPVLSMNSRDHEEMVLHGDTAVGLEMRGQRKLPAALLFIPSVLTCACTALCVYTVYRLHTEKPWPAIPPHVERGISLNMLIVSDGKTDPYLNFTLAWNNSLSLEHGSVIRAKFPGPYVLYFCALVKGNGNLSLFMHHGSTIIPFQLVAPSGNRCKRQQKVISLDEKENITFKFQNYDDPEIFLKVLHVGLHYLLGAEDIDTPEYDPDD